MNFSVKITDYEAVPQDQNSKKYRIGYIDAYVADPERPFYVNHVSHYRKDDREWCSFSVYKKGEKYPSTWRYGDDALNKALLNEILKKAKEYIQRAKEEEIPF